MTEKNKILLFNLLKETGNEQCAECGENGSVPDWASENLGIFLCVDCSGKHRSLGKQISFVRSLRLDNWADDKCEFMAKTGNLKSNAVYAKNVPACWRRPTPFDHHLEFYVEEWIRAKYERKEFMEGNESKQTYCKGMKDGLLMKKERHGNKWNSRYFRLSAETGSLSYYNKKEDLSPIKRMDIKQVNVILCSDKKTDKFFSMEITAPEEKEKKGKVKKQCERSIYVHAETGKDIVDWFLSIRAAKLKALNLDESDPNVSRLLSRDYIKEGFVKKSGPKENDRYIQRWITVEPNKFSYFTHAMDPTPKNEVKLRPSPELYSVAEGLDGRHPDEPHPFMVQTPERVFNFGAESKEEMESWMRAFKKAIESEPYDQNRNDRMSVVSAVSQLSISSSDSACSC